MYGLPDSALVGTAKRLSRVGKGKKTEVDIDDFIFLFRAVSKFFARRKAQRARIQSRARFYKKHGYYKQ
jgi:hypothetical protein